jgi:hypothetical protein
MAYPLRNYTGQWDGAVLLISDAPKNLASPVISHRVPLRTARAGKGYLSRDVLPVAALRSTPRAAVAYLSGPRCGASLPDGMSPEEDNQGDPCGHYQGAQHIDCAVGEHPEFP